MTRRPSRSEAAPRGRARLATVVAWPAATALLALTLGATRATVATHGDPAGKPASPNAPAHVAIAPGARAAGADESWWTAVSRNIEASQLSARAGTSGIEAPNEGQKLRTAFRE